MFAPRILLVEDSDDVRAITEEILRDAGMDVLSAGSCQEAIQLFETRSSDISLLVVDIVMPKMSGLELARILRQTNAELPILFISGYTDVANLELSGKVDFLGKPYSIAQIKDAVARMLAAKAA